MSLPINRFQTKHFVGNTGAPIRNEWFQSLLTLPGFAPAETWMPNDVSRATRSLDLGTIQYQFDSPPNSANESYEFVDVFDIIDGLETWPQVNKYFCMGYRRRLTPGQPVGGGADYPNVYKPTITPPAPNIILESPTTYQSEDILAVFGRPTNTVFNGIGPGYIDVQQAYPDEHQFAVYQWAAGSGYTAFNSGSELIDREGAYSSTPYDIVGTWATAGGATDHGLQIPQMRVHAVRHNKQIPQNSIPDGPPLL